jgi:Domain of unknown function (DUF4173)
MLGAMATQPGTMTRTADQALLAIPGVEQTIVDPADGRVLVGVAAAAVATDLAVRSGVAGLAGALLVAVAAAALLASGRLHTRSARLATAAAPLFGAWLAVRASPWLVPLDVLAAGGLLALGASLARGGSLADLTIPRLVLRAIHAGIHAVAAPAFVAAPVRAVRRHVGGGRRAELGIRIVRGLLLAAPILVVLGVLLASADAIFASFLRVDVDPRTPVEHAAALVAGAWGAAALLRVASVTPPGRLPALRPPIGAVEACVVLAGMGALFAVFTAAQLVALSEGGRHVLATAGLTYAEYARSGFFQLLAVAVITLGVLLLLRAATGLPSRGQRATFTTLAEVAVALTLVIVVVAVRRLNLYEDAFGLTMLRLYSELFSYWIGAVFLFLGAALAGVGHGRGWLVGAAGAAGLALLLTLNVANPEAAVARDQLAGTRQVQRIDVAYVAGLSEDAIPTVAARLPGLDPATRGDLRARLCAAEAGVPPSRFTGWAAWNLGRERAERAITRVCG